MVVPPRQTPDNTTVSTPAARATGERITIRYQPLVLVCGAVVTGIALNRWFPMGWDTVPYAGMAIFGLIGWSILWIIRTLSAIRKGTDRFPSGIPEERATHPPPPHPGSASSSPVVPRPRCPPTNPFRRVRGDRIGSWILLWVAGCLAACWHHERWRIYSIDEIGRYAGTLSKPVCVEAIAMHAPRRTPAFPANPLRAIPVGEGSQCIISFRSIRIGRTWRPAAGDCLLRVDGQVRGVRAGDRLRIFGNLAQPRPARNPGEFDFRHFARADRRLVGMHARYPECLQVIEPARHVSLQRVIDSIRQAAENLLHQHIGEPRLGLAAAVLLGAREGLPSTETESYVKTGTFHLLVVSGLHVGILAMGLFFAIGLGVVPRGLACSVAMVLVTAYALIADSRPPVVRAAVLTGLVCLAMWSGRRVVAYNGLAAAALVVLVINPSDLFRTGPQLSFLAVGVLIWYSRRFVRRSTTDPLDLLIERSRPWPARAIRSVGRWTGHVLLATLAVWATALPLVLHQFHIAAPIAILLSPLVWILIWIALTCGFLVFLVGWLVPFCGSILGSCCHGALAALETLVHGASDMPGGHFWWPGPDRWWLFGFYLLLFGGQILLGQVARGRWQISLLATWISVGLVISFWRTAARDTLECSFLSVGHGTCAVLEMPGGKTVLYDAGSLGSPDQGARTIAAFLWSRGITRIDGILLSHADIDHYNAVPDLIPRFDIGAVYVSPMMFDADQNENGIAAPEYLRESLRLAGIPIHEIHAGDRFNLDPTDPDIEVLHPTRRGVRGSDNANSLVILVSYRGHRLLFPGDLDSEGLDALFAELPIDCDIVLAPHHGSRHSDPEGFARWCSPEWVVMSSGIRTPTGKAEATYRGLGARVFNTAKVGAVRFSINATEVRHQTWFGRRGTRHR